MLALRSTSTLISVLLTSLIAAGCAPALSSMQPAHVAPKGHVQAELGMDISIPTGSISDVVDVATVLVDASDDRDLTQAEVDQIYAAAGSLALNPPSVTPHVGVGYTPIDNLEISLRFATSSLRLGGRYQFLNGEKHGVDASVGLGLGYYILPLPLGDTLQIVELEDFTRFQVDVPLVFGKHGNWYRIWGGPRFMYTHFGTSLKLAIPENVAKQIVGRAELASFGGNAFYVGGQGGVAVGYKHVFFGFELTLVQLISNGNLQVLDKTLRELDHNSFIVYPALGFMGEF
ncbi:hypothetical protein [Polyangium sp. 15x6]|uniref:hypothetical protein n=1 Tax=Polyangium sp. 15x6 TaxID=3042687 RepID=UPI00249AB170|nr:hypothetical protein [Polyangium sp. 15x6]MDI3283255.1 hypothetical protein [Polyangium sp. 15x6]